MAYFERKDCVYLYSEIYILEPDIVLNNLLFCKILVWLSNFAILSLFADFVFGSINPFALTPHFQLEDIT